MAEAGDHDAPRRAIMMGETRRAPHAEADLLPREPAERVVRDADAVAAQQLVDADERQRLVLLQPRTDPVPMRQERGSSLGRNRLRPRLHALQHGDDDLVRQLRASLYTELRRRIGVPPGRLAIDHSIARDLPRTLPRAPASEHLANIHHRQLPKAHGLLPTASRAIVGSVP